MLGDVSSAVALDLYAGTGALGIEALSRGAARAVFVENARPALAALRENIAALKLQGRAKILARSATSAALSLAREGPFDLIFLDPPYLALAQVPGVVRELESSRAIAPLSRLIVEHATKELAPPLPGFTPELRRAYGDTSVTIYRPSAA